MQPIRFRKMPAYINKNIFITMIPSIPGTKKYVRAIDRLTPEEQMQLYDTKLENNNGCGVY